LDWRCARLKSVTVLLTNGPRSPIVKTGRGETLPRSQHSLGQRDRLRHDEPLFQGAPDTSRSFLYEGKCRKDRRVEAGSLAREVLAAPVVERTRFQVHAVAVS
jgi:hypothetical protein